MGTVYAQGVVNSLPIVANLVGWFDASQSQSISLDTNRVTQWNDLSVTKCDVVQATAGLQPLYVPNATNRLPIVRFDGVDDYLEGPVNPIQGTTGRTFFFVCRADAAAVAGALWNATGTNPGVDGAAYMCTTVLTTIGINVRNGNRSFTSGIVSPTDFFVLMIQSPDPAPTTDTTICRLNGLSNAPASTLSQTINTVAGTPRIGRNFGSLYYDGDIGEIVIYDRTLSLSEVQSVENYLSAKWGVPL